MAHTADASSTYSSPLADGRVLGVVVFYLVTQACTNVAAKFDVFTQPAGIV